MKKSQIIIAIALTVGFGLTAYGGTFFSPRSMGRGGVAIGISDNPVFTNATTTNLSIGALGRISFSSGQSILSDGADKLTLNTNGHTLNFSGLGFIEKILRIDDEGNVVAAVEGVDYVAPTTATTTITAQLVIPSGTTPSVAEACTATSSIRIDTNAAAGSRIIWCDGANWQAN
jgi:hypothetical protein